MNYREPELAELGIQPAELADSAGSGVAIPLLPPRNPDP
jgi:hypothetical protein